jgi:hypothetical protein
VKTIEKEKSFAEERIFFVLGEGDRQEEDWSDPRAA